jgi:hypothetical protein
MAFLFQTTYGPDKQKKADPAQAPVQKQREGFVREMTPSKELSQLVSAASIVIYDKMVNDSLKTRLKNPEVLGQTERFLDFAKTFKPAVVKA